MTTTTKGRKRPRASAPDELNPAPKGDPPPDSRQNPGGPVRIAHDAGHCRVCARPLEHGDFVRRSWRILRSGEYVGGRGEFHLYRCPACGTPKRVLRSVDPAPWRGRPR